MNHFTLMTNKKGFECYKGSPGKQGHFCLGKAKGRKHPKINDMAQKTLRKFYKQKNKLFFNQTGKTCNCGQKISYILCSKRIFKR